MSAMELFYDGLGQTFETLDVTGWSTTARRIFLLLLPISGPLWLASMISLSVVGVFLMLVGHVCRFIHQLWKDA